ncbi:unnamed protein product [Coregonus sp. 'balchen']|nr:unnamed protein product [Coregonus sp. 'balchen']
MAIDGAFVPLMSSGDRRSLGVPQDPHDNTLLSCLSAGFICPLAGARVRLLSLNPTGFNSSEPWIALIQRGNCTFAEKIKTAADSGANGVVIYNLPGTGDEVTPMVHHGE